MTISTDSTMRSPCTTPGLVVKEKGRDKFIQNYETAAATDNEKTDDNESDDDKDKVPAPVPSVAISESEPPSHNNKNGKKQMQKILSGKGASIVPYEANNQQRLGNDTQQVDDRKIRGLESNSDGFFSIFTNRYTGRVSAVLSIIVLAIVIVMYFISEIMDDFEVISLRIYTIVSIRGKAIEMVVHTAHMLEVPIFETPDEAQAAAMVARQEVSDDWDALLFGGNGMSASAFDSARSTILKDDHVCWIEDCDTYLAFEFKNDTFVGLESMMFQFLDTVRSVTDSYSSSSSSTDASSSSSESSGPDGPPPTRRQLAYSRSLADDTTSGETPTETEEEVVVYHTEHLADEVRELFAYYNLNIGPGTEMYMNTFMSENDDIYDSLTSFVIFANMGATSAFFAALLTIYYLVLRSLKRDIDHTRFFLRLMPLEVIEKVPAMNKCFDINGEAEDE
eukprot:TRINITY_DN1924_c0_g3_i2.p1 TRINITY_DN1924_c0_g3~~TRINITY_DN1924_c0_g3_i2.p1  ORF type:complete len:450 (-),score=151.93 TRINITY_DN1924_c0_g3_i2:115-1464(-)